MTQLANRRMVERTNTSGFIGPIRSNLLVQKRKNTIDIHGISTINKSSSKAIKNDEIR